MQAKRMLKLADYLDTRIPKEGWRAWFNLRSWATRGFGKEKRCGSTACAMGWATVAFPRSGLGLRPTGDDEMQLVYRHHGTEDFGLNAAAAFFGISYEHAEHLFMSEHYREDASPAAVADRMRLYVQNWS